MIRNGRTKAFCAVVSDTNETLQRKFELIDVLQKRMGSDKLVAFKGETEIRM